jgi:CheY-like chemotaxis protein
MVYGFARELGGALRLQSDPGHGTTVSLFLRRAEGPPLVDTPEQARAAAPMGPGRVLLVDDDPGVRQSVRDMLEELGHEVVDVAGGADALECLTQDQRFDVLVFDFAMPLMNGAQLAEAVTQRWPTAPILFVTGYVENDALRPWSDRGYGTVRKPFDTNDLAEAVGRAMRRMEPAAG